MTKYQNEGYMQKLVQSALPDLDIPQLDHYGNYASVLEDRLTQNLRSVVDGHADTEDELKRAEEINNLSQLYSQSMKSCQLAV